MIDYAFNPRRLFVLSSFFSRFSLGWIYFNEQRARFAQLKSRVSSWRWSSETFTLFSLHHIQFHYPRLSFAISPLLVACLVPIFFRFFSIRLSPWRINICYVSHHLNINQWAISMAFSFSIEFDDGRKIQIFSHLSCCLVAVECRIIILLVVVLSLDDNLMVGSGWIFLFFSRFSFLPSHLLHSPKYIL